MAWRHGHGDMAWQNGYGDMEMETWQGDMDMETWNFKRKVEAQAIFLIRLPFPHRAHRSLSFVDEENERK